MRRLFAPTTLAALFPLMSLLTFAAEGEEIRLAPQGRVSCWSDRNVGVVELHHGGLAPEDGGGILLQDDEGPLPHRVLQAGPGDFLRIAFAFQKPDTVRLILPNSTPTPVGAADTMPRRPAASDWTPPAGVLLTTWPLPAGGKADSQQEMVELLKQVGESTPYGRRFVASIYHGYHPFPPVDAAFVSAYTGWFGCPGQGDYVFATSSDDASFLLIDGKPVVDWPGMHGARGDAKYQKTMHLSAGVHRIDYLHLNGGGPTITCAAWQPPGQKKILPIPPESFAPVATFQPAAHPRLLTLTNAGEAWSGDQQMLRFAFASHGPGTWDFGDGIVLDGPAQIEHVYLSSGVRTVTWRGKEGQQARAQVYVCPDPDRSVAQRLDDPTPYIEHVAGYSFDRLNRSDLRRVVDLLKPLEGRDEPLSAACRVLLAGNLQPKGRLTYALLLGERLRGSREQPEEALAIYRAEFDKLPAENRMEKAQLLREAGDTLFFYLGRLEEALDEYDKVVGRYADVLEDNVVRLTKIRIGDIYRQQGRGDKARQVYAEAADLMLYERTFAQHTVRKGGLYKAVDDFLRRGETAAALQWLDVLEWEYPLEKLDGYSSIARAKVALADQNPDEALKQLLWFVKAAPRSAYAAEGWFEAIRLLEKAGRQDEAEQARRTLREEYPDSPFAAQ